MGVAIAVLHGFADILAIVILGFAAARTHALSSAAAEALIAVTFRVALPALILISVAQAPLHQTLSAPAAVNAGVTMAVFAVYGAVARWGCRQSRGAAIIGAWSATYSNAGYLGVPIAAYVLNDITPAISIVLFQLTILMPVGIAVLEASSARTRLLPSAARSVARSPVVIAAAIGVALAVSGADLPEVVTSPLEAVSQITVPAVLLAYGALLHHSPVSGLRRNAVALAVVCTLKVVVVPGLVYVLARYAAGLEPSAVLATTLMAAMPTAVNVYAVATSYREQEELAQASGLITTVLSLPVIVVLTLAAG